MNPPFSYSLSQTLRCPRRFGLEKLQKEPVLAPFASSVLGGEVHARIAAGLRNREPADERPFRLPKRVLLHAGESLDDLIWRAHTALTFYNAKCYAWLCARNVYRVENYISRSYKLEGEIVQVSGILDLVLSTPEEDVLIDWKTGSAQRSEDQLKFYLMLRFLETGRRPRHAEAVALGTGEPLCIPWDDSVEPWFARKLERMRRDLGACSTGEAVSGTHCSYCPYAHRCELSEASTHLRPNWGRGSRVRYTSGWPRADSSPTASPPWRRSCAPRAPFAAARSPKLYARGRLRKRQVSRGQVEGYGHTRSIGQSSRAWGLLVTRTRELKEKVVAWAEGIKDSNET